MTLTFAEQPKTPSTISKKKTRAKADQLFQVFLCSFGRNRLKCLKVQRSGNENKSCNIRGTCTKRFPPQMSDLHESMCISKAGLSNLKHVRTKYKDKVLDVPDDNQNVETSCKSKLKLTEFKTEKLGS